VPEPIPTSRSCPECAGSIPPDAPFQACPRCLLSLALSPEDGGSEDRLAGYHLQEPIGRGAMGRVYRARQLALDRPVAVKMIAAGQFATEEEVRRFRVEARAAAQLQHPNVIRVIEVGEHLGRHFFSMELLPGPNLAELVRHGPLPPERAARLAQAIARAMAHAHGHGVLHRDLKPSNVLLDAEGAPKVGDFGLAKHAHPGAESTATGAVLGTPSYMAPEQARGERCDGRADLYAIGAILYELLLGHPPFRGESAVDTLRQVLDLEPAALRPQRPAIPRDLETICLKCLAKDPRQRYPDAAALVEELERFLHGAPIHARRPGLPERLWRWGRRQPRVAAAAGTSALLAALVVLGALSMRSDQLGHNLYSAQLLAPHLLQRFHGWGGEVGAAAASEPLTRALAEGDRQGVEQVAAELRSAAGGAFESVLILGPDGQVVARDPRDPPLEGKSFERRDYFRGALSREGSGRAAVHLSRLFPSQFDGLVKFALSAPVRDPLAPLGPPLGVIVGTVATDPRLGLSFLHDGNRNAVVVGRWDAVRQTGDEAPFGPQPLRVVVLHPAFEHGDRPVEARSLELERFASDPSAPPLSEGTRSTAVDPWYQDPMRSRDLRYAGPWLAGMAQVGNTEYVVIVQTRDWIGLALGGAALALLLFSSLLALRLAWGSRARA
jgi:eukaryotic-like serine/threonine-protein kinase